MENKVNASQEERWFDPHCTLLPMDKGGPFVELSDGNLITIEGNAAYRSSDDGKTWSELCSICDEPGPGRPSGSGLLLKTHDGVLVYVYMDMETFKWSWDETQREAAEDVRLDVWAIRSLDEGKTWIDRQMIFEGYCGALITIIQTKSGHIVAPVQRLIRNPCRHGIRPYVSTDNGKTWEGSNVIDLGGHGHHDGAMEPTLVELQDGRLWMLIRTNWDYFWETYSDDHGLSWRVLKPTEIDASSAPGYLTRLTSGRLVFVWNRLYLQGKSDTPRRGGDCNLSQDMASWQREELSIAFSDNDGKNWTEPAVIARDKGGLSYPYIFERSPGEIWVTTWFQGKLRVSLREEDFVGK